MITLEDLHNKIDDVDKKSAQILVLIQGNGGHGIFHRLEELESWKKRLWRNVLLVAGSSAALLTGVFKGIDLLGRSQGWW